MKKRQYIKEFAATNFKAPYPGPFPGMVYFCEDASTLPSDVESVSLTKKTKEVEQLIRYKKLRRVDCPLREEWLPILASMPNLDWVQFSLPKSAEIPSLACLSRLRVLVLRCNRHQDSLDFIEGMDWLHSLCISEAMGVNSLHVLTSLTELRELYIDGKMSGRSTVESLAPIGTLSNLTFATLLVRVAKVARTLAPLHALKELQLLWLSDDYSSEEYEALVNALPRLKQICFNGLKRWPPVDPATLIGKRPKA